MPSPGALLDDGPHLQQLPVAHAVALDQCPVRISVKEVAHYTVELLPLGTDLD